MRIILTNHLRTKIAERGIVYGKVAETIHHHDFMRPTHNYREERYKRFGKKYLMVVVREEFGALIVITAHFTAHFVGKLPKE